MKKEWLDKLDAAITCCDENGIITYMNEKAAAGFSKQGGIKLLGSTLFECHSQASNKILREMFGKVQERIYTTEKKGIKELICQKPIFEKGKFAGFMEIVIVLPSQIPHHIRD